MGAYAEKAKEHKNQAISNGGSQMQDSVESVFQFVDNRPAVAAQRKLKEMANNSTQAKQAAQLQTMVNNNYLQPQPIQKKGNNTGLPDDLKSGIENLSGMSMDDVKVHKNSDQPAQLNAHAYAQGTDIHLGPRQEKHLPHEAWHVVQQKQGRVKPTMQMKGTVPVNDDAGLEKEADVMGAKAIAYDGELKSSNKASERNSPSNKPIKQMIGKTVQRYLINDLGWKISKNEEIVWEKLGTLYAGEKQFREANNIEGGQVMFIKGQQHAVYQELNRVEAKAKPESALEKDTKTDNDLTKEEEKLSQNAREQFRQRLQDELYKLHEKQIDELYDQDKEDQANELEKQIKIMAKEQAPTQFKKEDIEGRIHEYIRLNAALKERPLMLTDCRGLASMIAGFDPASGGVTDEIAAGVVYEITESEQGTGEWPFHYATIIMTDSEDHITMENAAARASDKFSKMQYDKTWTFKMYGPMKGQTFDDEYAKELGY